MIEFKKGQSVIDLKSGNETIITRKYGKTWDQMRVVKISSLDSARKKLEMLKKGGVGDDVDLTTFLKPATDIETVASSDYVPSELYHKAMSEHTDIVKEINEIKKEKTELEKSFNESMKDIDNRITEKQRIIMQSLYKMKNDSNESEEKQ